ncbi:unnamed protein product [Blepharisma stoltei]|uniref:Uncharacterized protein n=1 Tax=Blepharisma stoltei TaxID=1481888 RepID=A0AAU9I7Y7_9CILI|nr:unnamed protein product [Blepharisma stoltei]
MTTYYTKSSPKLNDYNPLTHETFYSPPNSPPKTTYNNAIFRDANKIYSNIGPVPPSMNSTSFRSQKQFKDPITGRAYSYAFNRPSHIFASTANLSVNQNQGLNKSASQYSFSQNPRVLNEEPRYFKNRVRDELNDPLTGEKKKYNVNFSVDPLDTIVRRDKLSPSPSNSSLKEFYDKKNMFQAQESIAASLRKDVPDLSYVNPLMLKAATQSDPTMSPQYQRNLEQFFR